MSDYSPESFLNGRVVLLDKELEWSSFDLVNKLRVTLRNILGIKKIKVGHTGTLDPLATGLVILCTGKATKTIESYMGLDKEYIADITLGSTTPSFDLETEIDKEYPTDHINEKLILDTLEDFRGEIEQIPPIFSAKQVDGKRAYEFARQGQEVKLKKSLVTIHDIEILSIDLPHLVLRINCSKGTYIRSIAHDLGKALKSGAHLSGLRRTKIGDYHVNEAEKISDFIKKLRPL